MREESPYGWAYTIQKKEGMMITRILILIGSLMPAAVLADFQDGNGLYAAISSPSEYTRIYSVGYISGVVDSGKLGLNGFKYCVPEAATAGQLKDVVEKWLEENPATRHYAAPGLIAAALQASFPCKK